MSTFESSLARSRVDRKFLSLSPLPYRGFKAEAIASHVRSAAGIPLKFSRPVDKAKVFSTLIILFSAVSGAYRARSYLKFFFTSTYIWSSATMVRLKPSPYETAARLT